MEEIPFGVNLGPMFLKAAMGYELQEGTWAAAVVATGCITIPCPDAHPKYSG